MNDSLDDFPEQKPCPGCQSVDLALDENPGGEGFEVVCHECGLNGPPCLAIADCINMWNKVVVGPGGELSILTEGEALIAPGPPEGEPPPKPTKPLIHLS